MLFNHVWLRRAHCLLPDVSLSLLEFLPPSCTSRTQNVKARSSMAVWSSASTAITTCAVESWRYKWVLLVKICERERQQWSSEAWDNVLVMQSKHKLRCSLCYKIVLKLFQITDKITTKIYLIPLSSSDNKIIMKCTWYTPQPKYTSCLRTD